MNLSYHTFLNEVASCIRHLAFEKVEMKINIFSPLTPAPIRILTVLCSDSSHELFCHPLDSCP